MRFFCIMILSALYGCPLFQVSVIMWVINSSNHSISLAANGISFLLLFLSLIYICRQFRKSFLDKSVQLQCFEIEKGLLIIKGDRDIICNREPPAASFFLSENDGKRLAPLFISEQSKKFQSFYNVIEEDLPPPTTKSTSLRTLQNSSLSQIAGYYVIDVQ